MTDQSNIRYDFIIQRIKEGVKIADIQASLAKALKVNPDKCKLLLDHLADGPVVIEKAVTLERAQELKTKFAQCGLITHAEEVIAAITQIEKVENNCPHCNHPLGNKTEDEPCEKCQVIPKKYREIQRKQELIERERAKIKARIDIAKIKEEKQEQEQKELNELENIRRQLEAEMGVNQQPKRWHDFITGGKEISAPVQISLGLVTALIIVAASWFGYQFFIPQAVPKSESLIKAEEAQAQAKKTENVMQKAVGRMIVGSKKFAQMSGAADQFKKEIFSNNNDPEVQAQFKNLENTSIDAANENQIQEINYAAKGIAEAGNIEQVEHAFTKSTQLADTINDDRQREKVVNNIASSKFEIYSDEARQKAAIGNWRGAEQAFSQTLLAATEINNQANLALLKSNVAKARADSGDFGGASLIFIDALHLAEEINDPRQAAVTLAQIARDIAEITNDLGGAAERIFEKAFLKIASLPKAAERIYGNDAITEQKIEATANVVSYLINSKDNIKEIKIFIERADKDASTIIEPAAQIKSFGILARTYAEVEGISVNTNNYLDKIKKLAAAIPEGQRETINALTKQTQAEVIAAQSKFNALNNNLTAAKQGFLEAIKLANSITTNDSKLKNEINSYKIAAINRIGKLMLAAGDKQAAAKIFALIANQKIK